MPGPLEHAEPCVFLDKKTVSDGMGGVVVEWVDGAEFPCLVWKAGSVDTLIAQQQGNKGAFNITVQKGLPIDFHDVFKAKASGRIYRVTQDPDDNPAPDAASFDVKVGQAESYQLPSG